MNDTADPSTGEDALVFLLRQDGNSLTGNVDGFVRSWGGGFDTPTPITEGNVDGDHISFKAGRTTFSGRLIVDVIELRPEMDRGFGRRQRPQEAPEANRPAIGPAPDGSDPSRSPFQRFMPPPTLILHRVQR